MINYYLITKPGIVVGNLITFAAGFLLAARGNLNLPLFFETLIGLALLMASACVFNNYIDRYRDQKMERTKKRALVVGSISPKTALVYGSILGVLGAAILLFFTNLLATLIALAGFFVYVVIYSLWKSKTIYGTAIGSIAGAVPPVVGYCAVSNQFDIGAFILFGMLVLWQMPHFFSIVLLNLEDYKAAKIPVLPLTNGLYQTKIRMLLYVGCFTLVSLLLTLFNYTGALYFFVTAIMGFTWFWLTWKGFKREDNKAWSKQMFRLSLLIITAISFVIPFDTL